MSQNDYIFYSLKLINNKVVQSTVTNDPPSNFYEVTNGKIINDTSQWKVCVAKCDFRGAYDIPVFIPRISQESLNETVYNITISLNVECEISGNTESTSLVSSAPLLYIPFDQSITSLKNNTKQQDDPYYYVYDFGHLALMVNNTFETIQENLNQQFKTWYAQYDNSTTVNLETKKSVCEYSNDGFNIYFDKNGWSSNSTSTLPQKEQYSLYFDTNLWGILNNYPHILKKDQQYKLGIDYQFNYVEILVNDPYDNDKDYIKLTQYQSSIDYIMPCSAIQFTSNNLVVYPQVEGGVLRIEDNNVLLEEQNANSAIDYVDVLTEISVFGKIDGSLVYDPTNYRFLCMRDGSISDIEISIWWKNKLTGTRLPLKMQNNAQISILLLFQRKYI